MEKIVRYHEKILDYVLSLRKDNPELYFVPRKINNKGRLDKGYWFLGNEHYCYVSFWNGTDWKEKIHNIGFVVLKNKKSYIELSAQDSKQKAVFLEKVAKKIGGFRKDKSKDKWHRSFEGTDYLENLEFFIKNIKKEIDKLISEEKPKRISLIDKSFYNKYIGNIISKRESQIEFGEINKVARICWNTENWKRPSGSVGKSISKDSYENIYGYGHEEWLFDRSRIVNGYHYAFLEPLRLKSDKHENNIYNLSLFTINNLNKKYYVGKIENVECISPNESVEIYEVYKEREYIEQMKSDIEKVGGDWETFIFTEPQKFFNIKFKFKDVILSEELEEISSEDINITTNRFKLLPQKNFILNSTVEETEDLSEGNKKNTKRRKRVFNGECEYDPYHDKMQNALKDLLDNSGKYKLVQIERDRVDIKAKTNDDDWHYFEIKTDNPKLSIRKAIGQIMEYAYYPNFKKADKLIIISDNKPNVETIEYLDFIRDEFNIPLTYQAFDLENNELSKEY